MTFEESEKRKRREWEESVRAYKAKEEKPIICRCGSTQLTANKKGFGLGKAAIGGVLTGGVGLLAGFLGSGKVKITCLKCGYSWKAGKS